MPPPATFAPHELREAAEEMLSELLASRLEVVLIPSRDADCAMRGGMIRAVQEENCEWYQAFCDLYQIRRTKRRWSQKSDTRIKRRHTIAALDRIIAGRYESTYADRLMPLIEERAREIAARDSVCFESFAVMSEAVYELSF